MVREGYKETELGEIPEDWDHVSFQDILDSCKNGIYKQEQYYGTGVPSVRMYNIFRRIINLKKTPLLSVTQKEFEDYSLLEGDILINRVNSPELVGKVGIVPRDMGPATFESKNIRLRFKSELAYPLYINCFCQTSFFISQIRKGIKSAIAQATINREDIYQVRLPLPPLPEQHRIATVLGTIDECIEKTEALIAKLKQVKAGLMQDLLTRGIDDQGRIRTESTHEFKDTEIGRVPVEWDIVQLKNISSISYGISDAIDHQISEGIPTITLQCISSDCKLQIVPELLVLTDPKKIQPDDLLMKGDLLFNWRNGSRDHLGKIGFFNNDGSYTHVGFLLKIRGEPNYCISKYLWFFLYYLKLTGYYLKSKIQVNNTFNSSELAEVYIALPRLEEQSRIADILNSADKRIKVEEKSRDYLLETKKGLMSDLLTGKVRVPETVVPST